MNTKRHKRQSKKVKRKTKTYKKRNIRKYGGGGSYYLYSDMTHGLEKRPVYKFNVVKSMPKGTFASTYLGKIQCDNTKRVCIKEYGKSENYVPDYNGMFSKTLQNMKNQQESEASFPFNKEYLLRIYGKKWGKRERERRNDILTSSEFRGTELHKLSSQECSNFVCTLFDYGTILNKTILARLNIHKMFNWVKKYKERVNEDEKTCSENDCLYALLEKGKMDMRDYYYNILYEYTEIKEVRKQFYVIAMKMIRNIYCLHSKNIMHYDIKLENCVFFPINNNDLVDEENIEQICNLEGEFINDVKLIDFGFAEELEENDILTPMDFKGSPGNLYGSFVRDENEKVMRDEKKKLRIQMFHSRFIDIFAILKDINDLHQMNVKKSDIFGDFKFRDRGLTEQRHLSPFLDEQRKLLEEKPFSDLPYQNILDKLKKEYLDLDRSTFW